MVVLYVNLDQSRFKQRVWIKGARPEEEEIFQFTMVQVANPSLGSLLNS